VVDNGINMDIPSGYDQQFAMENRWPIEIDGLPNPDRMVIFHGKLLNNQMISPTRLDMIFGYETYFRA